MTATPAPVTIDVDRDHGVTLTWADGTTSEFGLEELRQQCPCAECRTAARSRSARLAVALVGCQNSITPLTLEFGRSVPQLAL
jgi:DUF971 family protein